MKLACFHLNQIGDLLFSLPALKSLKEWDPEGTIISVARPACADLLERTSLPDKVLIRRRGFDRSKAELVLKLKAEHPDAAVLFSQSTESMLIGRLCGAKLRYGITTQWHNWLLTDHVGCERPPSTSNNLKVTRLMGCDNECSSYVGLIAPHPQDREQATALLSEHNLVDKRLVVLAPGTSSRRSIKAWTEDGWASVIDHLSSSETAVVIVGQDDVSEILTNTGSPVTNLCNKTSLPILMAILEKAGVVIGVDSGLLHMAAAVGTGVVGLYGMSDPKATAPHGKGHTVITAGVDCSPCHLPVCKINRICMTNIDSERVIAAADSVLADKVSIL